MKARFKQRTSTIAKTVSNLNQAVTYFTFGKLDTSGQSCDLVPELDEGMDYTEVDLEEIMNVFPDFKI
jgi:hypothetical protein